MTAQLHECMQEGGAGGEARVREAVAADVVRAAMNPAFFHYFWYVVFFGETWRNRCNAALVGLFTFMHPSSGGGHVIAPQCSLRNIPFVGALT